MGIFGIYALICTFLLLAYYTVTIWFDLRGSKGTSKDETETIAADDMTDTEASTDIRELDGGGYLLDAAACDDEPELLEDMEDIVSGEEEANGQPSEVSVTDGLDGATDSVLSAGQSPEEYAEEQHDAVLQQSRKNVVMFFRASFFFKKCRVDNHPCTSLTMIDQNDFCV